MLLVFRLFQLLHLYTNDNHDYLILSKPKLTYKIRISFEFQQHSRQQHSRFYSIQSKICLLHEKCILVHLRTTTSYLYHMVVVPQASVVYQIYIL